MDENIKKSPIDVLANVLAEMSTRAYNAEAEVERLKADDNSWYQHWQAKTQKPRSSPRSLNRSPSRNWRTLTSPEIFRQLRQASSQSVRSSPSQTTDAPTGPFARSRTKSRNTTGSANSASTRSQTFRKRLNAPRDATSRTPGT